MELLPHDVVEYIFERLDVKTLLKFTAVSKQWKSSIIQCRSFQTRQMLHRKQSGKTDVVLVSLYDGAGSNPNIEALRTLVVGSTVSVKIPTTWENKFYQVCNSSCDGLICLYYRYNPSIVVNPTTRWHRTRACRKFRKCLGNKSKLFSLVSPSPGFGKDKICGTYKPVWLYNSAEVGLKIKSITTCEVFDFTTNAWRYIVPASPYLIYHSQDPVYCDGSLHWFTKGDETNILALDLHTETFQVIPRPPFLHSLLRLIESIICSLHDRLCVSERIWPEQVIWSFDSEEKTWKKIYSIDLKTTPSWRRNNRWRTFTPLSVLGKDKLLFYDGESSDGPLVTLDLRTKYCDIAYKCKVKAYKALCYVPSLISIL
ncbi:BnaA09g29640D [Brassica napus]|uniref:BnaA09g29640D protein n=1 Tax=Brassica napus TaxID=3708 RepID=A0A078FP45_BRANA|nr:BnaA09g29640D [Brassica napus]